MLQETINVLEKIDKHLTNPFLEEERVDDGLSMYRHESDIMSWQDLKLLTEKFPRFFQNVKTDLLKKR